MRSIYLRRLTEGTVSAAYLGMLWVWYSHAASRRAKLEHLFLHDDDWEEDGETQHQKKD